MHGETVKNTPALVIIKTYETSTARGMVKLTVTYFSHSSDYQILGSSHVTSKKPVTTSIWFTKFNYACKIHQITQTLSSIPMGRR
jgi:hypothetical protein